MDFNQRASILLHVTGFAIGVLVLPFAVFELFNYYDYGRDFEEAGTLLLICLISPIAGWILRWLISGEWSSFIPLVDDVFKPILNAIIHAFPKEGWSFNVLLIVMVGTPLLLYHLEKNYNQERWENDVFGMSCKDSKGNENEIGYFSKAEGQIEAKPIFCSDYLEENWDRQTVCTWDNFANANTAQCRKLAENPKPRPSETFIILMYSLLTSLTALILLTIINLIYNYRKKI